jgi:hypothetical protein
MAQQEEDLPSIHETLNSNPSAAKNSKVLLYVAKITTSHKVNEKIPRAWLQNKHHSKAP